MIDFTVVAPVFALIFLGELPDKTAVAGLVLGSRFPARWVWTGMAAAFLVHVVVAVAAGSLIALLPRRPVDLVVAALFLVGAVLLWREGSGGAVDEDDSRELPEDAGFVRVATLAFGVILVAEFGDLTQILTANLAAHYDDPLSVGLGAVLALWVVAALAIVAGRTLLKILPVAVVARIAAVVMVVLAAYSIYTALRG
ncbi:TMEM165/GDT1 family protein [Jatrophihabitans endophyticus]|uniref:TMEM165/GDT1 family protein n=1 Tax=Jatrophihabitans endophyticus TaxID=1206085 RepID=UPI001A000DB8|nr:TMEM165/GDT1 family protein [Jatrophihabitans endophyticus]MBE7188217.1 TMEM165/GDT1 family protein [Jatrophihabitans endophyticus]